MNDRFLNKDPWYKKYARSGSTLASLILLCIIFSILSPDFLNLKNILTVVRSCSVTIIMTMGMLIVIISSGIDLSIGCIIAVVGIMLAKLLKTDMSPVLAVLIALATGMFMGAVNGVLISVFDLQPFLVTLATQVIYRGIALLVTDGRPVTKVPKSYCNVIGGKIGQVPTCIIIMIVIVILFAIVMKYTKVGVYTYAIGGNREAARLSGINVKRYLIYIYVIDGLLAALAGATMLGRLGAAEPSAANGYELDAISAAAIGGTSMAGGKGTVFGAVVGALIMQILTNGMTLLNVQSYYQQIARGCVIIIAILIDRFTNKPQK